MKSKCYLARYPLVDGELKEEILIENTHFTKEIEKKWDELVAVRQPNEPMLQIWFSSDEQVTCLATTNQPYKLS